MSELVKNIIASTKNTVDSVDEIKTNTDELAQGVSGLNAHYQDIINCCDSMKGTISRSSHQSFIQTVKLDHIVWKADVYAVINGQSHKAINEFADHTMCRLGKWYYSTGKSEFSGSSSFRTLERPHEQVHKNGVKAMQLAQSGNEQGAIDALLAMEQASAEVMDCLDALAMEG